MTYNVFSGTLNPTHSLTIVSIVRIALCFEKIELVILSISSPIFRETAIMSTLKYTCCFVKQYKQWMQKIVVKYKIFLVCS